MIDTHPGYTVRDLAKRWRIGVDKVRKFLDRGELVAVNVADSHAAKPQWRIMHESVERFERRRSSQSTTAPQPRRRRTKALVDFYP